MTTAIITTAPGWSAALSPTTTEDAWKVAQALAKSQFVPKTFQGQPSEILIAAAMGARLGLDVFSALQSIAVVNGKPSLYGDALLAVCQARIDWRGQVVTWNGKDDSEMVTVTVKRQNGSEILSYDGRFGVADAKKAGVWTKQGPWSQYPKRMLELRARSYALRGAFADALLGFHAREEVEDYTDVTADVVVREEPRRGRMKSVAPSLDFQPLEALAPVEPVTSAHAETVTAPAAGEDVEPVIVPEVQDSPVPTPTVEDLREAVVYAGRAIDGGIKAVIGQLAAHLGYTVAKADDVMTNDRARSIVYARSLAGLEG